MIFRLRNLALFLVILRYHASDNLLLIYSSNYLGLLKNDLGGLNSYLDIVKTYSVQASFLCISSVQLTFS